MDRPYLIRDCLIHVFTFLTEDDLITALYVCKDWQEAADTPWLWRRLCLQRWTFCNLSVLASKHVNHSWKTYFLRRCHLEAKMGQGRTGAYTCKSLRGHTGRVVGLVYLHGNSALDPKLCGNSSTVCSASSDGTVRAWNVQNGQLLWCSPKQSPLTALASDEQQDLVITADSMGLVKTWRSGCGKEVASFPTASPHCSLLQFNVSDDWYLTVGTGQGSLCTLADSTLTKKSSVKVCDSFKVNILLLSPNKKWITAATRDNDDISPKVICTESLTSPAEDEDPVCQALPVAGCQAAVFVPTRPARLAVIHHSARTGNKDLTVFDVSAKKTKYKTDIQVQQVESFPLALGIPYSSIQLKAKDSNCLVVAADRQLWVYSLKGALLANFTEHLAPITSICLDSFRVVTASQDLSLRVLTWRHEADKGLTLDSRYHLLGGSHTMSRGFTHVASDYTSIVASVEGKDGKDVLKSYFFTS